MKIKLSYILILVILSAGFFYAGWYVHQPAPISTGTVVYGPDLSLPEPYLPFAYEQCPNVDTSDDYVCIYKLSHSTLAEADALAQKLFLASPVKNTEQFAGYYDDLHTRVQSAQKTRDGYFNSICNLDEMLVYGGSGMDLEREACRYYYAQQYLGLLKSLEKNVTQ